MATAHSRLAHTSAAVRQQTRGDDNDILLRHALPELTNAMLTLSVDHAHPDKTSADLDVLIEGNLSADKAQVREKAECEEELRRFDTILHGNERVTSSFADELTKVRVTAHAISSQLASSDTEARAEADGLENLHRQSASHDIPPVSTPIDGRIQGRFSLVDCCVLGRTSPADRPVEPTVDGPVVDG